MLRFRCHTISRAMPSACLSFSAKWSVTRRCASYVATAQFFSCHHFACGSFHQRQAAGENRRLIFTMMDSSHIAGTYAPPAVQGAMTHTIWGMPLAEGWPGL